MTELRERIARTIYNKYESAYPVHDTWDDLLVRIETYTDSEALWAYTEIHREYLEIADAVIAELGLQRVTREDDDGSAWSFTGPGGEVTSGFKQATEYERYLTPWVKPS